MKLLIVLLATAVVAGCPQKPVKRHTYSATTHKTAVTKVTKCVGGVLGDDGKGMIHVENSWIVRYRLMEQRFGSIDADAGIWQDSDNSFWISSEVSAHFSDMKIKESAH